MAAAFVYGTVIAGSAREDDHRFGLGVKLEIDDYKAPPFIRPPEEIL